MHFFDFFGNRMVFSSLLQEIENKLPEQGKN